MVNGIQDKRTFYTQKLEKKAKFGRLGRFLAESG